MPDPPLTIREALRKTAEFLSTKGSTSPRLDAEVLLAETLATDRLRLYLDMDRPLEVPEVEQYRESVRRRSKGEPTAYIVGYREFWSLPFAVDRRVLIPRPETELVVERAREILKDAKTPAILDVGTGSGAIAVALAREIEDARIWATDISEDALSVARENAVQLGVAGRIEFVPGDLLAGLEGPFDLIASNPPYVAERDRAALPRDVAEFEPANALFAGPDGLAAIRRLVAEAPARLKPGGSLVFEFGAGQEGSVHTMIGLSKELTLERCYADLSGKPRVAVGRRACQ